MIKKTFEELLAINEVNDRLADSVEKFNETKLGYAFKRFGDKNLKKIFGDYNEKLQDIRIDHALTSKDTGAILYESDGKTYQNTPGGLKEVLKKSKEVKDSWLSKEFEIEPYICHDIGVIELFEDEKEILEGVIINTKTNE